MFGVVVANPEKLNAEQQAHYKAVYCGLCKALGEIGGLKCRSALTYDLAFLIIILSSAYNEEYTQFSESCPLHPFKKRNLEQSRFTEYAADMNIALAYYKFIDDWQDDTSASALLKLTLFKKEAQKIEERRPAECGAIKSCLEELSGLEKNNILNPDLPAEVFGRLMANIFAKGEQPLCGRLYDFGMKLGKLIYIIDAAADLKSDILKKRYNPLIRFSAEQISDTLALLASECMKSYKLLQLKQDDEIIKNILLSGIWSAVIGKKKVAAKTKGNDSEQGPL